MIKLNFIKDRVKADQLTEATRKPEPQAVERGYTPAEREQVEAIKYFFKSWCGHSC